MEYFNNYFYYFRLTNDLLLHVSVSSCRVLARNTSVVVMPRITRSECSEQRLSIAHSINKSIVENR